MTPILTFTRGELHREVATLGAVRVGEVSPFNGGHRARAIWSVWLPDMERKCRPAESLFAARSAVQRAVDEWLMRSGVFYPGQGVEMRTPDDDAEAEFVKEVRTG
jgi:hypothetical protein